MDDQTSSSVKCSKQSVILNYRKMIDERNRFNYPHVIDTIIETAGSVDDESRV